MNNKRDGIDPRSFLSDNFNQSIGHQVAANFAHSAHEGVALNLHHTTAVPPGVDPQMFLHLSLMQHHGRQILNASNSTLHDSSLPLNLRHSGIGAGTGLDETYAANFSSLFNDYSLQQSNATVNTGHQRPASVRRQVDDRSQAFSPHSFSPGPPVSSNQMQAAAALAAAQRSFSPGYQSPAISAADYSYELVNARNSVTGKDMVNRSRIDKQPFSPVAQNLTYQSGHEIRNKGDVSMAYAHQVERTGQIGYLASPPPANVDINKTYSTTLSQGTLVSNNVTARPPPQRVDTPGVYILDNPPEMIKSESKVSPSKTASNRIMLPENSLPVQNNVSSSASYQIPASGVLKDNQLLLSMPELETLSPEALTEGSVDKNEDYLSSREALHDYSDSSGMLDSDHISNDISNLSSDVCACPVCDLQLNDAEVLKHHMLTVHDVQSIAPEAPEDSLNHTGAVEDDEALDVKPVVNNAPFDVFSVPESIFKKFSCVDCGAEFKSKDKLIVHVRKHTGQSTLLCTICGKSFFKTDKLARHMLVHSGERPYVCRHCGATFTRSDKLRSHLKSRHDDLSYTCRVCRDTFEDLIALKLHASKRNCKPYLPTETEEEERIRKEREQLENAFNEITSQIADPEIDITMMLNRDRLVAKFEETLKCGGTLDPDALVNEVVGDEHPGSESNENGIMPTVGLFADDAARIEAAKVRARLTHRKNIERIIKRLNKHRTIECPQCHLMLPGAYTLTRHLRVAHSIIKIIEPKKKEKSVVPSVPKPRPAPRPPVMKLCACQVCGKSFTKFDTLKRHEMIHTGERAFKCLYCDAKYSRSDRLRKHLKSMHVQGAYPCIKCSEVFENRMELRKHISIHRLRTPKPVREPRIRGPYKKRKQKLEVNSADNAVVMNSSAVVNDFSLNNSQTAAVSTLDKNGPIEPDPSKFSESNCSASLMTIEQDSNGDSVFRLSSEQLSNALAIRNHVKSSFHVNKSKSMDKPVPLDIPEEALADSQHAKTASSVTNKDALRALQKKKKKQDVKGDFSCAYCGKVFSYRCGVRKHELRHHSDQITTIKEKKYECQRCGGRYTRFETVLAHSKNMHNVELYHCKSCDIIYDDLTEYSDHITSAHDGIVPEAVTNNAAADATIFTCRLCHKICDTRAGLRMHMRKHQKKKSGRKSQYCDDYDETESEASVDDDDFEIDDVKELEVNTDSVYTDAQLSMCAANETSVLVVGRFKRGRKPASHHLLMSQNSVNIKQEAMEIGSAIMDESGFEQFSSDVQVKQELYDNSYDDFSSGFIGNSFRRTRGRTRKDKRKPVVSDDEGASATDSDTVDLDSSDYAERENDLDELMHQCDKCRQRFSDLSSLREHVAVKHVNKRLVMTFKGLSTDKASVVRDRSKGAGKHECNVCGQRFKKVAQLRRHAFQHRKYKTRQFDVKRKYSTKPKYNDGGGTYVSEAAQRRKLERMEAQASEAGGEINNRGLFQCRVCSMSFSMISKLRNHVQTHVEILPSSCNFCVASFENKDKLEEHMKVSHVDIKQVMCLLCSQNFSDIDKLHAHMQEHMETRVLRSHVSERRSSSISTRARDTNESDTEDMNAATVKLEPGSPVNGFHDSSLQANTLGEISASQEDDFLATALANAKQEDFGLGLGIEDNEKKLRGPMAGNKHLSCPVCNKGMSSQHSLKRHVTSAHTDERPYVCCDCPKAFSRMDKFRNHLRRHFGFIYPCTVCGATFYRWYHWKKHMMVHSISCQFCDFSCVNQSAMARHVGRHTGEKQFSCTYCGKQFFRKYHLQIHVRRHTGEMPYSCDKCGKRFFRSDRLKRHLESHDRDGGLLCATCGKSFTTALALRVHSHIHDAVVPQTCQLCNLTLPSPKEMRKHRKQVHPGEIFIFCTVCGKQFVSHDELVLHTVEHLDGNNPPEGFVLTPDGTLMPSTVGGKPLDKQQYLCSICGLQVSSKHALIRHQRVHTGERNFTCQYCSHQFTTSYGLRRHVEKHENPRIGPIPRRGRKKKLAALLAGGEAVPPGSDDLVLNNADPKIENPDFVEGFGMIQEGLADGRTDDISEQDGINGNSGAELFDALLPTRDLSFEGNNRGRMSSVDLLPVREIKQEQQPVTSFDESSRSTQSSPLSHPLSYKPLPHSMIDRRGYPAPQQYLDQRDLMNRTAEPPVSHSFSAEFYNSLGIGRSTVGITAQSLQQDKAARRSDMMLGRSKLPAPTEAELLSLTDQSAALERINRSTNILSHDISRNTPSVSAVDAGSLQQVPLTGSLMRDAYMRMGNMERGGERMGVGGGFHSPEISGDSGRQPLDLAKMATSSALNMNRFN